MRNSGGLQDRCRPGISVQELEKAVKGNKPAIVHMDLDRGQHGAVVDGFATRGGKKFVAALDPAGETANKSGETSQLEGNKLLRRRIYRSQDLNCCWI